MVAPGNAVTAASAHSRTGARVLYVVPPSPTFAGVERVIHDVANAIMLDPGNDLRLSVLYFRDYEVLSREPTQYELIHRTANRLRHIPAILHRLLREQHFDLAVIPQVEAATFTWMSRPPRRTQLAIYLHGNPWVEQRRSWQSGALFLLFRLLAARRYQGVLAVTPALAREFQAAHPCLHDSYWVPNPVRRFPEQRAVPKGNQETVTFLNVGRLSYQKGQDVLLEAFARVRAARPTARLRIVGQGEMRPILDACIARLALGDAVEITSMPTSPGPAFATSDIFVSASRWEGWSLVIVEALSFGLPVVATDCNYGPRDILTDSRLGHLVPNDDVSALADAMLAAHDRINETRQDVAVRVAHAARFHIENVVDAHVKALRAIIEKGRVNDRLCHENRRVLWSSVCKSSPCKPAP
jgi:glycosyltransferase involved in cell wall biosynthesis